jgi:NRAMP (natural resistance-associated macrophage protein)-like metal ion transporter
MDIGKFFKILGPGFVTGASDDDPSGIGTYAQTGVQFGYTQLWLALFTLPFMTIIQQMCGKIEMVSGKGLSRVIKKNYPDCLLYFIVFLLFVANTINIGADLSAMAESAQLLLPIPMLLWLALIAIFSTVLQVLVPYKEYSKYLKYLGLSLLAYVITAFVTHQNWAEVLKATFIPTIRWDKEYLMNIVAILGTTISPYLFFWQASEEVEKAVDEGRQKDVCVGQPEVHGKHIDEMRIDTMIGMFFSNLVMFFIIITMASTLRQHGVKEIESAAQAAQALKPIAGNFAFVIFTLGVIGTGLLAVPVLAGSASYAISELFGWRVGLSKKLEEAWGFYLVIILAMLMGLLVDLAGIPPFRMLYYAAILNGLCAPPILILIMLINNNKNIMGKYANTWKSNLLGWIITGFMTASAVALLFQLKRP